MIDNPIVVFLNTQGILLFVFSAFLFEYFIIKKKEVALHLLFSIVTTAILVVVLKELYSVPRPFVAPGIESQAGLAYLSSFPSLHSALAFSTAITVAIHQTRLGVFFLIIAALISIGRVAANVHYPIDVAFGVMIGVLVGMFFDKIHFAKKR